MNARAVVVAAAVLVAAIAVSQAPDTNGCGTGASSAAQIVVDAIRTSAKAEIAFQPAGFFVEGKLGANVDADGLNKLLSYPQEEIYVVSLSGTQVKKALERGLSLLPQPNHAFLQVSGITVTYSASEPAQSRVRRVLVGTKALSDSATYKVAMPATLAKGALGYFTVWQKSNITDQTGVTVDAAVRTYLNGKGAWPLGETNRIVGE
jgi:2',3'-cyclic-nucleotide 2'-phosphodiesterase (5'-nucleotidase family)